MIYNTGFEDGWTTDPSTGNQTPNEWQLIWKQPGEAMLSAGAFPGEPDPLDEVLQMPECVHKLAWQLPPNEQPGGPDALILDGETTYKMFGVGFSATLYQTIPVEPGSRLTFTVPVQVHEHGDGSWGACAFRVWIDDNHSQWATFGDGLEDREWVYITASVIADSDTVNVGMDCEGRAVAPVDFFVDAIGLEIDDPEPLICRGAPRVQYERTYHVYPAAATPERRREIALICADLQQTAGPSYDDAGLGDLDDKTAVLWDIPADEHWLYEEFFAQYYPGTAVEFVGDVPEPPAALWQRDPAWRDRHFGAPTCDLTIGQAGCFITAIAEAQRFYGIRADATPVTVDQTAGPAGYNVCLLTWAAIESVLGMYITSSGDLDAHLDAGRVAILRVLPESPQHFVLAMRRDGADYIIRDPLYGTEEPLSNRYVGIHSFRRLHPQDAPPEPQYTLRSANCIGLHSGFVRAQSWNYVQNSGTNIQKFFSAGDAYRAGFYAPGIVSIWRKFVGNDGISDPIDEHAQWLLDQYSAEIDNTALALGISVSDLLARITAIESLNEQMPSFNPPEIQRNVEFDCRFAEKVHARYGDLLHAVLLNVAVGNPHESEVHYLLPAAQAAMDYGGFLGYHAYWAANETRSYLLDNWNYHAGRWQAWDTVFAANGIYPRYALGEAGICYAADGQNFQPHLGWKSCGPFSRYLDDIDEFNRRVMEWNGAHGNRCAGATLFGYGQWDWDDFELGDGDVLTLNDWANGSTAAAARLFDSTLDELAEFEERVAKIAAFREYVNGASYLPDEKRGELQELLRRKIRGLSAQTAKEFMNYD